MINFTLYLWYAADGRVCSEDDRQGDSWDESARDCCNKAIIATIISRFSTNQ